MKKRIYPSFRYHKTETPKVVHSEDEHQELGPQWKESPAHFESESSDEDAGEQEMSADGNGGSEDESSDEDAGEQEMSVQELRAKLIEQGIAKKDLKGKNKTELQAMLEG